MSLDSLQILDVTLRDGSYLIDFQFSQADTAILAKALETAGINWIEVGHGVGLGASEKGYGKAAATDREYLEAAAENLSPSTKWGMFFIPGIGTKEDIYMAAEYKMPFLRVGTNITEVEQAEPYIRLAKELGMFVAYNGMKSYAVSPEEFAKKAQIVEKFGVDMICLVDSAGGFYPDDVKAYFQRVKDVTALPMGFHGHDNLNLVMANTLTAIEHGAIMVDTSLQGMGRSAGNAVTEVLVAILKHKGIITDIDLNGVINIGQNIIQPLVSNKGMDPLAIISGYARFHSSFTSKVTKYAKKYDLDVRDLIVRLCEQDKVNAPDQLLEKLGSEMARERIVTNKHLKVSLHGSSKSEHSQLETLLKEVRSKAAKFGKYSTLNIVFNPEHRLPHNFSNNIHTSQTHIIGSVTVRDEASLRSILAELDGQLDCVFLDIDPMKYSDTQIKIAREILQKTLLLTYSDSTTWSYAVEEQIVRLCNEDIQDKDIILVGNVHKSRILADMLAERNANVTIVSTHSQENEPRSGRATNLTAAEAVQKAASMNPAFIIIWSEFEEFVQALAKTTGTKLNVLDAAIGAISPAALEQLLANSHDVMRVNIWPALTSHLLAAHESYLTFKKAMGRSEIDGVAIISGGAIGMKGDVIVDNIHKPSRIIGVADGRGNVISEFDEEMSARVNTVTESINQTLLAANLQEA